MLKMNTLVMPKTNTLDILKINSLDFVALWRPSKDTIRPSWRDTNKAMMNNQYWKSIMNDPYKGSFKHLPEITRKQNNKTIFDNLGKMWKVIRFLLTQHFITPGTPEALLRTKPITMKVQIKKWKYRVQKKKYYK